MPACTCESNLILQRGTHAYEYMTNVIDEHIRTSSPILIDWDSLISLYATKQRTRFKIAVTVKAERKEEGHTSDTQSYNAFVGGMLLRGSRNGHLPFPDSSHSSSAGVSNGAVPPPAFSSQFSSLVVPTSTKDSNGCDAAYLSAMRASESPVASAATAARSRRSKLSSVQ